MANERWLLLEKLKRAVKKINFLINFNLNKWKLASIIGVSSGKKRLSFNNRPGLRACVDDEGPLEPNNSGSSNGRSLQRTISYPSSEDDINKRAEAFIANFYKQLQYERQISLELRYYRGDSFGSSSSQ
ncbi:Unknown protein [Striga hermonthica]|uniref:Uncharacterized protein n=1 Tax=Striga hermonthica TaxID=68872 RepID=A0A9N7N351_STRHE|nr:Unknown protein [Striga hermonthica]